MYYVIKWETTRYYLVGPFADEIAPYVWAEKNADPEAPYNGWDVLELDDPTKPPEIIAPEMSGPAGREPLHLVLRPTPTIQHTREGSPVRAWVGHTNSGIRITGFVAGIEARERSAFEDETKGPQGQGALDAELKYVQPPILMRQ